MVDPLAALVARVALALVFGVSALHKARDLGAFAEAVRGHRLAPEAAVPSLAAGICALEAAVAGGLLHAPSAPLACAGAAALLGLYSTAIATNLARGHRDVDCGCSLRPQPISPRLLARNALLLGAAALAAQPPTARPLGWLDAVAGAACLASLALLWLAAETLATLRPARPPGSA